MKKLLALNFNNNLAKKVTIIALALAVVIGMSYLGSQGYLNMSIMDILMGGTVRWNPGEEVHLRRSKITLQKVLDEGRASDQDATDIQNAINKANSEISTINGVLKQFAVN